MAVTQRSVGGLPHYYGLSGDSKPTSGIPGGAVFIETDTGDIYEYSGSAWFKPDNLNPAGGAGGGGDASAANQTTQITALNDILTELAQKLEPGDSVAPQQIIATTGTVTRVASSATTVTLIASNSARAGLVVHNNSTADLYIKYGATADIAGGDESYTYQIPAGADWEMGVVPYTGRIDCIWSAADGYAVVTELT